MKKRYVILLLLIISAAVALRFTMPYWVKHMPECAFYKITGFYCPGCGGTRAVIYLLKGNIITAFKYNPGVVSLAFIVLLAILGKIFNKKILPEKTAFWVVFIGILMLYYVLRNFTSSFGALQQVFQM